MTYVSSATIETNLFVVSTSRFPELAFKYKSQLHDTRAARIFRWHSLHYLRRVGTLFEEEEKYI